MNKQEAIERIESRAFNIGATDLVVGLSYTKYIINQINKPQKVVVPKFVAEWIERRKKLFTLYYTLTTIKEDMKCEDFYKWFSKDVEKNTELLASAWIDGYEIVQEKLYTVEIQNPNSMATATILEKFIDGNHKTISLVFTHDKDWKNKSRNHLTEDEIKQDFEWAWKWAKEVE